MFADAQEVSKLPAERGRAPCASLPLLPCIHFNTRMKLRPNNGMSQMKHATVPAATTFEVRAARSDDYASWLTLWTGYNAFYGRSGHTALPFEVIQLTWSRFFDEYEPMHALVAEQAGELIGLVHFLYHRSTIQANAVCYLQDLFTAQSARGQGVGRALIAAVYEHARCACAARVYWQTHESNAAAMRLYDSVADKSGFIVYRHAV
jgi:GNAT superfamily N-acetyltransferase